MLKPAASELIAAPNAPAGASRIPTIAVSSRSKRRLRLKRVISGHVRAGVATHDFRNEETMNENVHRCSSPESNVGSFPDSDWRNVIPLPSDARLYWKV
jgi:hypothetical protein